MATSAEAGTLGGRVPVWHLLLFALVLALALGNIALAVAWIVLLSQDADMVNALTAHQDSESFDRLRALVDTEQTIAMLALLLLIALYFALYGWLRTLNRELAQVSGPGWYRRLPAYRAWRFSMLALALLFVVTDAGIRTPAPGSPAADSIAYDNELSWGAVARIVIALFLVWVAVSVLRAGNSRFAQLPPHPLGRPDARPRTF